MVRKFSKTAITCEGKVMSENLFRVVTSEVSSNFLGGGGSPSRKTVFQVAKLDLTVPPLDTSLVVAISIYSIE